LVSYSNHTHGQGLKDFLSRGLDDSDCVCDPETFPNELTTPIKNVNCKTILKSIGGLERGPAIAHDLAVAIAKDLKSR